MSGMTGMAMTNADSLKLKQLRKDMYYHYSKRNTQEFLHTISLLKDFAKKNKLPMDYYKAYGNEAIYTSSYIHRGKEEVSIICMESMPPTMCWERFIPPCHTLTRLPAI